MSRPVPDGAAELPPFISAPSPRADRQLPDRQLPDRQLPDRQLPDRPTLADVIELEDDRDTDSGLVETPEMPADDQLAAKAPRRRTPRKAKVEAEGEPEARQPTPRSTDEAAE